MKLFIEKQKKNMMIKFSGTGSELLKKLKINPQDILLIKNDVLISEDDKIKDSDEIKILSVVSGG